MLRRVALVLALCSCSKPASPPPTVAATAPVSPPPVVAATPAPAAPIDARTLVTSLLDRDGKVFVQLDARRAGVVVPEQYRPDTMLFLELARSPSLKLTDTAIAANVAHLGDVVLPWSAIYEVLDVTGTRTKIDGAYPTDLDNYVVANATYDKATGPKLRTIEAMLVYRSTLVYINATMRGVVVPEKHEEDTALALRFGYNLEPDIPDLTLDKKGISGTLSFSGKPFFVHIPWAAVRGAIYDGYARGVMW
jgi:stringent starvation protein B